MTTIAIAGNPNCGKSTIFNCLTGIRQTSGNWPGTVGIFTGVLAKEVVVGTLDSIYTQIYEQKLPDQEEASLDLFVSLSEATATIPQNLSVLSEFIFDPPGLKISDI